MDSKSKLHYLCLQKTNEGQASYAHVHEIIAGLKRHGWKIRLFEPVYKKNCPGALARLGQFLLTQARLWFSQKPDVVYIRHHFASWPTALWARLKKIPVVQEVNGPYEDVFIAWPFTSHFKPFLKWLMRSQLRWADIVITVTPQLASWVTRESKNANVYVVPNAANIKLFTPQAAQKEVSMYLPETFVIFFGALTSWQGIDTMLEAVRRPEWPQEVRLVIVGDGVERQKVEEAAAKGEVSYLGKVPYREIPPLVARSLAGLSPQSSPKNRSKTGLFPLKVFETLACGVPVIVSDFPGMADLVRQGKCGIVIPPENPKALAEAVRFLYHHPEIRKQMGQKGRELIKRQHSWDARATQTHEILLSLINKKG
ncbi:MAG: glycosyltransferase family 4 protein [Gammaproteobacteria bacterium]|nr:glycosyltransferase family 4 protein [Gammaproteobacteria bacterium]